MSSGKDEQEEKRLDWRDYVAIFVAMLQTNLFPYLLLLVALLMVFLLFQGLFRL